MEKLKCLRCDVELEFVMREKLQLGQTGWILGDLPNLLAGALETAIFTCPRCGGLELFRGSFVDDGGKSPAVLPRRGAQAAESSMKWTTQNALGAGRKTKTGKRGNKPWAFLTS